MSPVAQSYLPEPEVVLLTLRNPRVSPGNPSEPLRPLSRKLLVKFGEEKGNVTAEARTRYLWRLNTTRTPRDYRVSHTTRQEKLMYLSCNRKETRKN